VALLREFVQQNLTLKDILVDFLCDPDPNMRIAAIELYVRKIYQKTHHINNVSCGVGTFLSSQPLIELTRSVRL
jgi:hypothetical protein